MKWESKFVSDPRRVLLRLVRLTRRTQWLAWPPVLLAAKQPCPYSAMILASNPQSRCHYHFRASGLVHNTININVLWLRRLWKNFLPHQYWWCCHTLESGPSLRIYKRNAGGGCCLYAKRGPMPFLVCTSMMYIFLPFRAISLGEGRLQHTLDEIWVQRGCAETDPIPPQCFAGDDSYGKMNVSFQGIWEC